MSKETLKVLDMLDRGKLTVEQAEQLLTALRESSYDSQNYSECLDEMLP